MKELSTEEKAKLYDEAIKRVENIMTGKCETTFMFTVGLFEHIFPELAESEDDRIRKGIIRNLEYLADKSEGFVKDELKERIAWLEKQGHDGKKWLSEEDYKRDKEQTYKDGMDEVLDNPQKYGLIPNIQGGDKIVTNEDGTHFNISQLERIAKPENELSRNGSIAYYIKKDSF